MIYRPFICFDAVRIFAAAADGRTPRSPNVSDMPDSGIAALAPVALSGGVLSVPADTGITAVPHPVVAVVQGPAAGVVFPSPWPVTSCWQLKKHFSRLASPRSG
jgi:hypothetical protein